MMNRKNLKMCQACRGLIGANETVCPLCGVESHYAGKSLTALSGAWSVTMVLLTVNLIAYAVMIIYQAKVWGLPEDGQGLGMWSPSLDMRRAFGDVSLGGVAAGQYWRLLTMFFLHGGLLHLGLNSYALVQVGRLAEEAYGGAKFFCVYLISGLAGSLAVIAVNSPPAVGASGAIFGLIGAMAVYGYKRGGSYGNMLKSAMVQWIIYGLVISFLPGISMAGHVGGLLGGAGIAYLLSDVEQTRQSLRMVRWWQIGASVGVVLVLVSMGLAAINVWRTTETRAMGELTKSVFNSLNVYTSWREVKNEEDFEQYRRYFGSTVTTLELTRPADDESGALQQRMLDILRARRDQLNKAQKFSDAPTDPAQQEALKRAFKEFEDWLRRKGQSLGIPESSFRQLWTWPEEEPGSGNKNPPRSP